MNILKHVAKYEGMIFDYPNPMPSEKLNDHVVNEILHGIKEHQYDQEALKAFINKLSFPTSFQTSAKMPKEMVLNTFIDVKQNHIQAISKVEATDWINGNLEQLNLY